MVPSRVLVLIMVVKQKYLRLLLFYMLIFSDELVKNDFKGFHNWYQFLIKQQAGQILYKNWFMALVVYPWPYLTLW